ncbi:hypothetical protein DK419_24290 [Methylobacterium terrae]|uniref:RHS protein conserved region domain-containing protein n=1 Tax=Methylobacterium terrae TaxID=2202827 RepID=A0A2U8WSP6_9HYPH|nr:RHS repeat-associated core domain-containing protein [Methylobacterium terrae]AWN49093.1 hypothetical protein DK419_24290 [Methylobacterium terrae]
MRCETPEGAVWHYRYDAFGRRLSKVRQFTDTERAWVSRRYPELVPAALRPETVLWTWPEPPRGHALHDPRPPVVGVQFLWDGDVVAEEAPLRLGGGVDWAAATRWHYEPESFVPVAKQEADGSLRYIVTDHLGTPREMFDEAGGLRWAVSLTTWGCVRRVVAPPAPDNDAGRVALYPRARVDGSVALKAEPDAGAYACPIRFQGQWADEENGANYNWYRYYDPILGQYVSPDPFKLSGGDRLLGYVQNPNLWIDPIGWSQRLQAAVNQAVREIGANPSLAKDLMTPASYRHLVVRSRLAQASYGKAIERRTAQILEKDPTLEWAGKYLKGPDGKFVGGPDFSGSGGATYDITTGAGVPSHLVRPYGQTTGYITYPSLPENLVFPP